MSATLSQFVCYAFGEPMAADQCCGRKSKRTKYSGLIFHDLRRTAARNLRRAGISETVIMKIGGWKTRSVFERYAIVSRGDMAEAMQKLESNRREMEGHILGHSDDSDSNPTTSTTIN